MCLVIDANCFRLVFSEKMTKHKNFVPVQRWIYEGHGRMIYGGTKYNKELKDWGMLGIVSELSKKRKTVQIPTAVVDPIATALKAKFPEAGFDDEHIVALVIASRCRVVCTNDNPAISYLKRPDVFSDYHGVERPKIFRGHKDHIRLCCDEHLVAVCREQA
jgi:hypothetical protein